MNGEDLSDEQLMLMFRYGNRGAFELLFEKHRGGIYNFARRMLGERAGAEDACQETFLKLVGAAGRYEPSARFTTWLYTIARNCCISTLRRRDPIVLDMSETVADPRPTPGSSAEMSDVETLLEHAIGDLPEDEREAFLLRFRRHMAYQDIAEVTGRPLGTVKTHIHRARLRLAERMRDVLGDRP